ncbi:MAG: acyl-CoA dehydrogenase N-terminal domain-containing protein, partial [Deltaproteobacteria bacterium]|nr:acyl-CoA dehydrogenase N-terminal domain-containing protein [Deltaproteobacteria bacterium]
MAGVILDERDQKFMLYEMLEVEKLCESPLYEEFSKDVFDMILKEAEKLAVEEIFPTLKEGDHEGCTLKDGQVYVPKCFHRVYKLYCEGGWNAMSFPPEMGGQGLPIIIRSAGHEWFTHNFAFVSYTGLTEGAAYL